MTLAVLAALITAGFASARYLDVNYVAKTDSVIHDLQGHPRLRADIIRTLTIQEARKRQLDRIEKKLNEIETLIRNP